MTKGQYFPVWLKLARLVSSVLYEHSDRAYFEFAGFRKQKIHSLRQNGPYGETRTRKKQLERTDLPQDYLAV